MGGTEMTWRSSSSVGTDMELEQTIKPQGPGGHYVVGEPRSTGLASSLIYCSTRL